MNKDTLKKMAELWPEMFHIAQFQSGLQLGYKTGANTWGSRLDGGFKFLPHITQDDIDQILALIGWEYEVHLCSGSSRPDHWGFKAWRTRPPADGVHQITGFITKLFAAQAALDAVVSREAKTQEVKR